MRTIPLNECLFDELRRLNEKRDGEYVFTNQKTGGPITDVKTAFLAALRRAKISGLRFHDLRHTFATRLVERGVDLITVKELLGHFSVEITQRYTHSFSEQKRKAVLNLDSLDRYSPPLVPTVSPRQEESPGNVLFSTN